MFEEALTFLEPRGSMVIAQRQPVAERFRGGQTRGQTLSQPIWIRFFEQPFPDVLRCALGYAHGGKG